MEKINEILLFEDNDTYRNDIITELMALRDDIQASGVDEKKQMNC